MCVRVCVCVWAVCVCLCVFECEIEVFREGGSRLGTMAVALLMREENLDLSGAFAQVFYPRKAIESANLNKQVKAIKGSCNPNPGFMRYRNECLIYYCFLTHLFPHRQLTLFESMGNTVDKNSATYKGYILDREKPTS